MPRPPATVQDANYVESDRARADLTEWLRKQTGAETEEGFRLTCFADSKNGQREIGTYAWSVDETIDKVAEEIIEDCEEDCLRFRGKLRYSVIILSTVGRQKKCNFTLRTPTNMDAEPDFDNFDDEMPDARGIIGQTQRHTEVFAREMVQSARGARTELREIISELRTENASLKRDWFEQKRLYEELVSMQFARDREIKKDLKSDERKDEAIKSLKQILPFIANKVLGQGQQVMDPGPLSPSELMLANLLDSLDGEQQIKFAEFAQTLNPVQQAIVVDLQTGLMQKQQAASQAKTEQAPPRAPSPTHMPFSGAGSAPGR